MFFLHTNRKHLTILIKLRKATSISQCMSSVEEAAIVSVVFAFTKGKQQKNKNQKAQKREEEVKCSTYHAGKAVTKS